MKQVRNLKKQAGITLMEIIAGLLIIGLVVSGALALFGNADSAQKGNQMMSDITALRSAVKGLYAGQGGYGTANINGVLKNSNRIPATMMADTSTPPVITHSMNGTITVTGVAAGAQFEVAVSNVPTDVCVQLLSQLNSGWASVQVGAAAAITSFPVSPATASSTTNCAASNANTIKFVGA